MLNFLVAVDDIPESGLRVNTAATGEERASLSTTLNILSLDELSADLLVRHKARGRFHVGGRLEGKLTQACVVSLKPIEASISEAIDTEYWPRAQIEELESEIAEGEEALDVEALASDGPEPIENGRIDVGQLLYETLSTSIDPFPRQEGAVFEWSDSSISCMDNEGEADNPFAVLQTLKSDK